MPDAEPPGQEHNDMPTHPAVPEISLIVNTYMKPRHLELVLDSIEQQEGVVGGFEVVVSDDGSTDETAELVARRAANASFRIAFTSRPHDGFRLARVRNDGARLAHGKRLLFLDGDCMLPRNHVAVHLSRCREGVATGGDCGRLDEFQSRSVDPTTLDANAIHQLLPAKERAALKRRLRKWRWYSLIGHPTKPRLVGNNICIHRRDFDVVNGFDERFVGWGQEDDDITLRLRAVGVRLETVLDRTCSLHVWHPTDPTATARWRDGTNVRYFLRRGRLACCRQGLTTRGLDNLRWRLPADLETTATGRGVALLFDKQQTRNTVHGAPSHRSTVVPAPEIDLVVWPGRGSFARRTQRAGRISPECRVLLVEGNNTPPYRLRSAADVVLDAPLVSSADTPAGHTSLEKLAALLETVA